MCIHRFTTTAPITQCKILKRVINWSFFFGGEGDHINIRVVIRGSR